MFQPREKKERFHDLVTFISAKPIKKMARGVEKPGIEIAYKIGDGSKHRGEPWTKNAYADSLKHCQNVLQSLREGDLITLELTVNGNFKNLAGVIQGHIDNPNKLPIGGGQQSNSNSSFAKPVKNDYNERAAKGQALNLAFQVAIANGKVDDDAYILSLIPRMLKLGEAVQNDGKQLSGVKQVPQAPNSQAEGIQEKGSLKQSFGGQESNTPPQSAPEITIVDDDINDLFGGM
jgi:hypothetical protein